MLKLCLFDLDQTLVDTDDMTELREEGAENTDANYLKRVEKAFLSRKRHLFTLEHLNELREENPNLKFGIFTRAPRSYTQTILRLAFPKFKWDVVIAYEDVKRYKPNREGIYRAMIALKLGHSKYLPKVLFIGDGDLDIRAAYHAGCRAALFRGGWPTQRERTHWRALDLLPDATFDSPQDLRKILADPNAFLPDLENALTAPEHAPSPPRFDRINKFFDWEEGDRTPHPIHAMGRSFAGYGTLDARRGWHDLSSSIQDNKDSETFPAEWIKSIRRFIAAHFGVAAFTAGELTITVIPPRPDRAPRLNLLLQQLADSYEPPMLRRMKLVFDSTILAYKEGVKSHSREHLSPKDRFANVRDHLHVPDSRLVKGRKFLVIDDVSTTGATLLYAQKYLKEAGAASVTCLTIAMNITDPVKRQ